MSGLIDKPYQEIDLATVSLALQQIENSLRKENLGKEQLRFCYQAIHDLKLPLSTIKYSLLQLMENGQFQPEIVNIDQASKFIGEILNLSLQTSGQDVSRPPLDESPFRFHKTIQQITDLVSPQMIEKKIDFKCQIEYGKIDLITGDESRLKKVLLNLIGNAMKFTPAGGEISLIGDLKIAEQKTTVSLCLKDSGIGISKTKLPYIFQDFSQAHDKLSKDLGGQGLGLGIVKSNVKDLGGTITVKSEVGKGTEFFLDIPFETTVEQPKTILIVEDEPQFGRFVESLFNHEGYRVVQEGTIKGAKEKINSHSFDFIVSDQRLEETSQSGQEIVDYLANCGSEVPVAILSGFVEPNAASYFETKGIPVFKKSDSFAIPLLDLVKRESAVDYLAWQADCSECEKTSKHSCRR